MQDNGAVKEASRWRLYPWHPRASLLVLLSIVFLLGVLTGVALRDLGQRYASSLGPQMARAQRTPPSWWRTRFPPPSVYRPISTPGVKFDPANVLSDLTAGSLDGATLTQGTGAFVWGWAFDPRTQTPALAVILFDNGRELSPSVQVYRERPDVVAEMHEPRLMTTGWNIWLPDASLGDGREHVFEAFALFEDLKLGQLGGKISVRER